jgi:single-strand DNA-binding protein
VNSLASATIIGLSGGKPELRHVGSSGQPVTRIRVAVNHSWKPKDGEKQQRTDWFTVNVWGRLAEICCEYIVAGTEIVATGRLQVNISEKDGQKREYVELVADKVLFDNGRLRAKEQQGGTDGYQEPPPADPPGYAGDDIPF